MTDEENHFFPDHPKNFGKLFAYLGRYYFLVLNDLGHSFFVFNIVYFFCSNIFSEAKTSNGSGGGRIEKREKERELTKRKDENGESNEKEKKEKEKKENEGKKF